MLRKLFVLPVVALLALPAIVNAQFQKGDWELTLAASGASSKSFDDTSVGGTGSLGYFLTKEFEVSVRESLQYVKPADAQAQWPSTTRVAVDYHFDFDRFQPFIGANIGYMAGRQPVVRDGFEAAPEVGLKYFVNATTFVFGQIEYDISLRDVSDRLWTYSVGIGFRF